jgi:hypothetical protein
MRNSKARAIRRSLAANIEALPPRDQRSYSRILRGQKTFKVPLAGAPLNPDGTLPEREVVVSMFQIIGPEGRRLCRYMKKHLSRGGA